MNEDTKNLLLECSSGCKMAIQSIEQVMEFCKDEKLKELLEQYDKKHQKVQEEVKIELENMDKPEKEPGAVAEAFAYITTSIKLTMRNDVHQIAKIMMDGCGMGIEKVSEYANKYQQAEDGCVAIARDLVRMEEDFMKELEAFV